MLLELRAENYAVIDRAEVRFGRGLNLMTGETGAGKSILIDALALLLGGKASVDSIRHGAEKTVVTCVFEATSGALRYLWTMGSTSIPRARASCYVVRFRWLVRAASSSTINLRRSRP